MLHTVKSAWGNTALRTKILITLGLILLYRVGAFIPAAGVDNNNVQVCLANTAVGSTAVLDLFTGGALTSVSILALGIMPFITGSILMQLLSAFVPQVKARYEDAPGGQEKKTQHTRMLTLPMAAASATITTMGAADGSLLGCPLPLVESSTFLCLSTVWFSLVIGALVAMWMAERITIHGIGNGASLLIMAAVASSIPTAMGSLGLANGWLIPSIILCLAVFLIAGVVYVESTVRKVKVLYTRGRAGNAQAQSSFIPVKVNPSGVLPIIFAASLLAMPMLLTRFGTLDDGTVRTWAMKLQEWFGTGTHPVYIASYLALTILFALVTTGMVFDTRRTAEQLKAGGGFINGFKPGEETRAELARIVARMSVIGAIYLAIAAAIPLAAVALLNAGADFPFGGASLLILVAVGLDTSRKIASENVTTNYGSIMRESTVRKPRKLAKV